MITVFHLVALVSGPSCCACWLTVVMGGRYQGTKACFLLLNVLIQYTVPGLVSNEEHHMTVASEVSNVTGALVSSSFSRLTIYSSEIRTCLILESTYRIE